MLNSLNVKSINQNVMNEYTRDPAEKKVRYAAAIIYILVMTFIVGGSYWHQQQGSEPDNTGQVK